MRLRRQPLRQVEMVHLLGFGFGRVRRLHMVHYKFSMQFNNFSIRRHPATPNAQLVATRWRVRRVVRQLIAVRQLVRRLSCSPPMFKSSRDLPQESFAYVRSAERRTLKTMRHRAARPTHLRHKAVRPNQPLRAVASKINPKGHARSARRLEEPALLRTTHIAPANQTVAN